MSDIHQSLRPEVFVRLDDLTPDEREFVVKMQNGILAARFQEATLDAETALQRRNYVEAAAKEQTLERENAEIRLQAAKDLAARDAEAHKKQLADNLEYSRPSRTRYIAVSYDEERGKFVAAYSEIRATGNSPEEAFRNFDQLWLEGHYHDTL